MQAKVGKRHCKDETPGISRHLACKCGINTVYLENSLQNISQENLLKFLTEKSHKNHTKITEIKAFDKKSNPTEFNRFYV